MNNNILVLGYGLLGKEIVKQTGWDYVSREKDGIDFADLQSLIPFIDKYESVFNAIAFTKTYSDDKDLIFKINCNALFGLANYCLFTNKKLIHISSDYVYAGSELFAKETDIPIPAKNWYSLSKLMGDVYIESILKNYLIIRTSFKPNPFPYDKALICQMTNADYVDVIANMIIRLVNKNAMGLYNVGTEPKTIFELAFKTRKDVVASNKPIHPSMPANTLMDISKYEEFIK